MKITSTLGYSIHKTIIQNRWSNKIFHSKQKLKQYMATKSLLQRYSKELCTQKMKANKPQEDGQYQTTEEKTRNLRVALIQLHTIKPLNNKNH
jgi:hypothetical protein